MTSAINTGLLRIAQFEEKRLEIPGISRRSSIAVILRFKDTHPISAAFLKEDRKDAIEDYLNQLGTIDPNQMEVLFIKRATSDRDRWSSHIALPGGRCEKGETDREAAVRETFEEVGLNLERDGLYVGPLDQRPLKIEWGMKTIMVLCPYVFILFNTSAKLKLQTSEVATAFWHPYSKLVDFSHRSFEVVPMGHRLNLDQLGWVCPRIFHSWIRASVGKLGFPAIDLHAQDLLHDPGVIDDKHLSQSIYISSSRPYKLWGVTYNVLLDFFALLSPGLIRSEDMSPPVLQHRDMRFIQGLVMKEIILERRTIVESKLQSGLAPGSMDLINTLIDGLGPYLRRAIAYTLMGRVAVAMALITMMIKTVRRK